MAGSGRRLEIKERQVGEDEGTASLESESWATHAGMGYGGEHKAAMVRQSESTSRGGGVKFGEIRDRSKDLEIRGDGK